MALQPVRGGGGPKPVPAGEELLSPRGGAPGRRLHAGRRAPCTRRVSVARAAQGPWAPRSPGAGALCRQPGAPQAPSRKGASVAAEETTGCGSPPPLPAFRKFALRRHFTLGEHLRLHLFAPTANGKKSGDGRFNEKGRKVGITAVSGAPRSVCPAGSARSGRRRGWACCAP